MNDKEFQKLFNCEIDKINTDSESKERIYKRIKGGINMREHTDNKKEQLSLNKTGAAISVRKGMRTGIAAAGILLVCGGVILSGIRYAVTPETPTASVSSSSERSNEIKNDEQLLEAVKDAVSHDNIYNSSGDKKVVILNDINYKGYSSVYCLYNVKTDKIEKILGFNQDNINTATTYQTDSGINEGFVIGGTNDGSDSGKDYTINKYDHNLDIRSSCELSGHDIDFVYFSHYISKSNKVALVVRENINGKKVNNFYMLSLSEKNDSKNEPECKELSSDDGLQACQNGYDFYYVKVDDNGQPKIGAINMETGESYGEVVYNGKISKKNGKYVTDDNFMLMKNGDLLLVNNNMTAVRASYKSGILELEQADIDLDDMEIVLDASIDKARYLKSHLYEAENNSNYIMFAKEELNGDSYIQTKISLVKFSGSNSRSVLKKTIDADVSAISNISIKNGKLIIYVTDYGNADGSHENQLEFDLPKD